jgi:hypothetical protein
VNIGSRLGWTGAHIAAAGAQWVDCIDPEYRASAAFRNRAVLQFPDNLAGGASMIGVTSEEYFTPTRSIDAPMIDGNHDAPEPTRDAARTIAAGAQVLVWHDFQDKPIRDAVSSLLNPRWRVRIYWTPNMMAVAWREGIGFVPPNHVRDAAVDWSGREREIAQDFDLSRCI